MRPAYGRWLPLLFGVVALGVGIFFVVSLHETLSTVHGHRGHLRADRRRHRDRRLDLRLGREPRLLALSACSAPSPG
jgi:hypothetical protein